MPMDEKYFEWLYRQVRPEGEARVPYMTVAALAHRVEFDYSVPNDGNRASEGKDLRYEFLESSEVSLGPDREWLRLDASLLEVIVALARRCDFAVDLGADGWFDIFMKNLDLWRYNDALWVKSNESKVQRILEKVNNRTYSARGKGGLFPLKTTAHDQREVELWYQMSEYMAEHKMY